METLLTPDQVAERCQVKTETIQHWLRTGQLPGIRVGRKWRIAPAAFEAWLRAHSTDRAS